MTDREVLEAAVPVIENQWCQGAWIGRMLPTEVRPMANRVDQVISGAHPDEIRRWEAEGVDLRYCAMGALQMVMGCHVMSTLDQAGHDPEAYRQLDRIAKKLVKVADEQYPDWWTDVDREWLYGAGAIGAVEAFNDNHTREVMLAIFEKTLANE